MLENSKVIWKEGMFLQPQHFQQSERFMLNVINSRMIINQPFFYGITEVEIDKDALANDLIVLLRCTAVLPDGTTLSIPKEDNTPPARSFSDHFSHDLQTLDVFVAIPVNVEGRGNVSGIGNDSHLKMRFRNKPTGVADEVYGTQRKEIDLGGLNITILFGDESLDNFATIPIAKLKRNSSGQITLADEYIPPLLQIGASQFLLNQTRGLLEMLLAKNSTLSQGRKQVEGGFAEFASTEDTALHLLQTLNTYTPLLNYYHSAPLVHPFDFYSILMMFAGSLSTFSSEVSLKQFPRYDHHNLSQTFFALIKIIRTVLNADISAGCITVPVEQINAATFVCKIPDEKLLSTAKFYFAVSARLPEKELIIGVLQRIKMCSRDRLDLLISSAMPGLPLLHTTHPPEGLSTKPGYLYFALDQQSQFWRGMQSSASIAFYFPNNYPELKLEMLALKG